MNMKEHRVHQFFQVSVLLKGTHALIECLGGTILALVETSTIVNFVNALTQEELIGDANDFVATQLLAWAQTFSIQTQHFYAFYPQWELRTLIGVHGAVALRFTPAPRPPT